MQDDSEARRPRLHASMVGDDVDLHEADPGREAQVEQWIAGLEAEQELQFQARAEAADLYSRFVERLPVRRHPGGNRHRRSSGAAPIRSRGSRRVARSSAKSGDDDDGGEPGGPPASPEVLREAIARHDCRRGGTHDRLRAIGNDHVYIACDACALLLLEPVGSGYRPYIRSAELSDEERKP